MNRVRHEWVWVIWSSCLFVVTGQSQHPAPAYPVGMEEPENRPLFSTYTPPDPRFSIGLEAAFTSGESAWEIRFHEIDPLFGYVGGRSKLEWKDLDSIVYRVQAEFRITSWLRVSGSYALGDIDEGRNTDTDWVVGLAPRDLVFSKSVADTDGDLTMADINLYLRLNKVFDLSRIGGVWDAFLGFQYHEEDLRDRNGFQVVYVEEMVHEELEGLDSTYAFEWQAVRAGVRADVPLASRLRWRGQVAGLLGARFKGSGYWNLREDFREEEPNFLHRASAGFGLELRAALAYDLFKHAAVELGWWGLYLRARDGTDTTYFADGEVGEVELSRVTSRRSGMFVGASARF